MSGDSKHPGDQLRSAGFQQGTVLEVGLLLRHLPFPAGFDYAIVISQDCDIVRDTYKEPTIELLLGRMRHNFRAGYGYGRNPRVLDLELTSPGNPIPVTFKIRDRVQVFKEHAVQCRPSALICNDVRMLARWVGKRYTRPAWPDEFNERLKVIDNDLESKLFKKATSSVISGMFIMVDPLSELEATEDYRLQVWLTMQDDDFDDPSKHKQAEAFAEKFEKLLEKCNGIDTEEAELRRESDVTLADLRVIRQFDRDYRSYAPKPGGSSLPPES